MYENLSSYNVLGLMSGTSLDGVDLALCRFDKGELWSFKIIKAVTIEYPEYLRVKLQNAIDYSTIELERLDKELARFYSSVIHREFKLDEVDFIASHGHTIFHQPEKGITLQVGDGTLMAELTGLPVAYDFRTEDVKNGGQGAPLVPIGDQFLFSDYSHCINLGGIANVSFDANNERTAFDIAPCNMLLNTISKNLNQPYDDGGKIACEGEVLDGCLKKWNAFDYFHQSPPKSLGYEWVSQHYFEDIKKNRNQSKDMLRTAVEHIATQIATALKIDQHSNILITGGGAYNSFLIERIESLLPTAKVIIPDNAIIEYKEALIFAFLGVLKVRGEINVLKSVTGARSNSSAGKLVGF